MTLARRTPKAGASACPDLPLAKPRPGQQRRRSVIQKGLEMLAKTDAKVRDFFRCQFPGCGVSGRHNVEAAHLEDSGMGGRFSVSNHRRCFITLCRDHHQGRRSLHTGYIDVRPLSEDAGDGPLGWWVRTRQGNTWGPWQHAGRSGRPILPPSPRS